MYQQKKIGVVIAAAGFGKRMKSETPKQFLKIDGVPILALSIMPFEKNQLIDEIVIVTGKDYIKIVEERVIQEYGLKKVQKVMEGGQERQDSVWKALKELSPDVDIILIHDGARPYVSQDVILGVLEETIKTGAAIAAVPSKDTIKFMEDGIFTKTPKRERLYNVQTPQGFSKALIFCAYEQAYNDGFYGTDDATLVERLGEKVYFSMGDYKNIKITTPEDLPFIQSSEDKDFRNMPRIGIGYDVHRLVDNRKMILGGVEIPFEKGLLGHSDADVLLHALMDAMLGAAALGDIGKLFPDNDTAYKDISSLKLLEETNRKILDKGYQVSNTDITIIAQRPKISKYIEEMKKSINTVLKIGTENINIKGTTTEKLGFCGREEGIAAEAAVILRSL